MFGFGKKKYIYLTVYFENGSRGYSYRTTNKAIKVNDVVMVPAGDEVKPAIVAGVDEYTEDTVPYPVEKTKEIVGLADRKNRKIFKDVDMRPEIDISVQRVKTKKGVVTRVTTAEERAVIRKQLGDKFKIIETKKPAKPEKKDNLAWIDELEAYHAILDDEDDF